MFTFIVFDISLCLVISSGGVVAGVGRWTLEVTGSPPAHFGVMSYNHGGKFFMICAHVVGLHPTA